jgi:hypothetical protein
MTSTTRPDGGDLTAQENLATKWPRCVGMGGRDASESVAAIVGMRMLVSESDYTHSVELLDRLFVIERGVLKERDPRDLKLVRSDTEARTGG